MSTLYLVSSSILSIIKIAIRSALSHGLILPIHIQQIRIGLLTAIAPVERHILIFSRTLRIAMFQADALRYLFV